MTSSTFVVALVAFQHTAARRRLAEAQRIYAEADKFQHTAARRRLVQIRELNLK